MPEVVVGRWKPPPGTRGEDLEIPGPGTYEADFEVPGWLVPDLDISKEHTINYQNHRLTHLRSRINGNVYTLKFRVEETEEPQVKAPTTQALFVGLTIGVVVRYLAVIGLGALAGYVVNSIANALREVRKLAETPAGIGLAGIGVGVGALLLFGAIRGK